MVTSEQRFTLDNRRGPIWGSRGSRVQISPARPCKALSEVLWPLVEGRGIGASITGISHSPCESHTERSGSAPGSPFGGRQIGGVVDLQAVAQQSSSVHWRDPRSMHDQAQGVADRVQPDHREPSLTGQHA
jgi:hypothetical protein